MWLVQEGGVDDDVDDDATDDNNYVMSDVNTHAITAQVWYCLATRDCNSDINCIVYFYVFSIVTV